MSLLSCEESTKCSSIAPLVICGPSGVGKGTLRAMINKKFGNIFCESVSHTTRNPRKGEKHGVDYYFVSDQEFHSLKFIETFGPFNGKYYGTAEIEIERIAKLNMIPLFEVHYTSAEKIKAKKDLPFAQPRIIMVSTSGGTETLEQRIKLRQPDMDQDTIDARLAEAAKEFAFSIENPSFFDTILHNNDLEICSEALCEVLAGWYPAVRYSLIEAAKINVCDQTVNDEMLLALEGLKVQA